MVNGGSCLGVVEDRLMTVSAKAAFRPTGELAARIAMVHARFLDGQDPAYTDDFILADVELRPDYPRRFAEFSGDVSGRYIGAMALLPPQQDAGLARLVRKAIACQCADGRFGDRALSYASEDIGPDQMALLWGNGRMLIGLMEYHVATGDAEALGASRRLGDFIIEIKAACSTADVTQRLEGAAANGYICFTQNIEGLAMLYRATQDTRYLDAAEDIAAWFQRPRGVQHSHGHLTTLRGIMMLHEITEKAEYLDTVEGAFAELVASPDYLIFGGVPELFSNTNHRDEGCSEADFVRLSLQLWRATGKLAYLEYAERCLVNHLYGNQFDTGDFGHHVLSPHGIAPCEGVGRAWWCCTMHGLRAFCDVLDCSVTSSDEGVRINLFVDGVWTDGMTSWRVCGEPDGSFSAAVDVPAATEHTLAIRRPSWADEIRIEVNDESVIPQPSGDYIEIVREWARGDTVRVAFTYAARLVSRDGKTLRLDDLSAEPVEAALFYGPWLLGVDSAFDPLFYGEPWQENAICLPHALMPVEPVGHGDPLAVDCAHFRADYRHGGFPDLCRTTLRPFSEQTRHEQSIFGVWLRYRRP